MADEPIIKLFPGHTFGEIQDLLTAEFINKIIENGFAKITNLPFAVSIGGTGGQTAAGARDGIGFAPSFLNGLALTRDSVATIGIAVGNSVTATIP